MANGSQVIIGSKGQPSPPDLSSEQLSLLPEPTGDNTPPPGIKFGDIKQDVRKRKLIFRKGVDRVSAIFWSANPRYDLLTEGTFAVVERLLSAEKNQWIPAFDDDDFSLFFKYNKVIVSYCHSNFVINPSNQNCKILVRYQDIKGIYFISDSEYPPNIE